MDDDDPEYAKKFVDDLGLDDRIGVFPAVDSGTGHVSDTYALLRPHAGPAPIYLSGDCAAVREAIASGSLVPAGDGTYKKRTH
jgi:hypothetical protein